MSSLSLATLRCPSGPRRLAALLVLFAVLPACVPEETGGPAPLELLLSPSNPKIAQGTAEQFMLRGLGPSGRPVDLTERAAWRVIPESGDAAQPASEVRGGLVALSSPGRYRVLAEYDGQRIETPLIVTTAALRSLLINPTAPKVAKGLVQQFRATATFTDGTTQDVTALASWSVRNLTGSMVATISSRGLATAKNVGKVRVTALYQTSSASATLEVTPAALESLLLKPLDPSIIRGSTQSFYLYGIYSDGTAPEITHLADWFVTDVTGTGVATIDETGTATGDSAGQARVQAFYLGKQVETTLTVNAASVVRLTVNPAAATVVKGAVHAFVAVAELSDRSTQDVSSLCAWTATDLAGSGVASVDASGKARGQAVGLARIECSYRGFRASATLDVKLPPPAGLTLSPAAATVPRGLSQAFRLIGSYPDGSTQDLTAAAVWTARDLTGMDVTSLSGSGEALGKNLGQAEIKAEYSGKSATATLTVTSPKLVKLALSPAHPQIGVGKSVQFTAAGSYSDGTTRDLSTLASYSATDIAPGSGVATISAGGLATGTVRGQAKIAASYLGLLAETTLTVGPFGVCSADNWCWQNPLPQGHDLQRVWGSDARNVWVVGEGGTIV